MPLGQRGAQIMSFQLVYNAVIVVPRRRCRRYTTLGPSQAPLPSSLSVLRIVVEKSCPSLADLEATGELVSKLANQREFSLPRANGLRFSVARQGYPGPSRNWVDQQHPMLMPQTAMPVLKPYGTGKGVVCALSVWNSPSDMAKGEVNSYLRTQSFLKRLVLLPFFA